MKLFKRPSRYLLALLLIIFSCKEKQAPREPLNKDSPEKEIMTEANNEWKLIWEENFEGEQLDPKIWNRQVEPAGRFNEEWQRYTNDEENAYVENGKLVIVAKHKGDLHEQGNYTSARLNTAHKQTFKYGKISARIKLPKGNGIWPAFWTLGNNIDENGGDTPWPFCGEIDILELYGSKDNAVVEANIHYANESGQHEAMGSISYELETGIFADDYHVFKLEWTEKSLKWLVDGKLYHEKDIIGEKYQEFHHEHFILLNIAVGGLWAGEPDDSTAFPQKMMVDWIRYYKHLD